MLTHFVRGEGIQREASGFVLLVVTGGAIQVDEPSPFLLIGLDRRRHRLRPGEEDHESAQNEQDRQPEQAGRSPSIHEVGSAVMRPRKILVGGSIQFYRVTRCQARLTQQDP